MDKSDDELNFDSVSDKDVDSSEENIEIEDVSSDSEDEVSSTSSEEETNQDDIHDWGGRKGNYYGGIDDDINEDGLEMKETRELEKNQLNSLKEEDYAVSEGDEEEDEEDEDAKMNLGFGIAEEEVHKSIDELSDEEIVNLVKRESPELFVMLPDIQTRLKSLITDIKPLYDAAHPQDGDEAVLLTEIGKKYVDAKCQLHVSYCMMLLMYMLLKSEKKDMKTHPMMKLLVKSRSLVDKVEAVENILGDVLYEQDMEEEEEEKEEEEEEEEEVQSESEDKQQLRLQQEEDAFSRLATPIPRKSEMERVEMEESDASDTSNASEEKPKLKKYEEDDLYKAMTSKREQKKKEKEERKQYHTKYVNEDYVLKQGESRKATQKILKNRGLVPSRPRENRNPRVKKRLRYEKSVKRRKGQVAGMRTEEAGVYTGEKSGIRADVTHSRRF